MGSLIVGVGILAMIVIHEGGHFLAAKAFGMKATEAFFGFGPKLWSIKRGETEYGVKAIPLGGYVRIIGMNPLEEVDPEEEHRTYRGKPFWQKSVVVLAGIGSHFVVAFVLFVIAAAMFGQTTQTLTIDAVSEIYESGDGTQPLAWGETDRVLSVDGVPIADFEYLQPKQGEPVDVVVDRDGVQVTLKTDFALAAAPAASVDIRRGDTIVSINNTPVSSWDEFVSIAQARPNESTALVVERNGTPIELTVTLAQREIDGTVTGFLGVAPGQITEKYSAFGAVRQGASFLVTTTGDAVIGLLGLIGAVPAMIGGIFSGNTVPVDDVRPISPIGLVQIAGQAEIAGAIGLLASVNVFVGVLNLFPMFPLDGGHFVVAIYEKIRGRSPDIRKLMPVAAVVLAFLVTLGLYGVYLDIFNPIQF
ncbi:MAG: RIP metalloprotease RseP [Actinobacteria bacterium]|nr:RIP metalloprotease RseP [Actinomycetota bacterium]